MRAKDLEAVILFVDFSKAFDSVNQGKMTEIKKSYGILGGNNNSHYDVI